MMASTICEWPVRQIFFFSKTGNENQFSLSDTADYSTMAKLDTLLLR